MQVVLPRPQRVLMNPLELPSLAAWYDLRVPASTTSSDIRIDGSNRVSLIADKSGNSAVNCLCMNGGANQGASSPDSAATSITGDIDLRVDYAPDSWTPAVNQVVLSKYNTSSGNHRSYWLRHRTTGALDITWSGDGVSAITALSTATISASAYSRRWVRATLDVDNGAGGWTVQFFTSTDSGATWTQLGADVTGAGVTSIFDGPAVVNVGGNDALAFGNVSGRIYRAQIYNGIAGTLVFDANFTAAAKLATSFTESSSNAATVTIASSGALGARISGDRDWVQLTASNQPIYTAASSGALAYATFDGTDDYMKAAAFGLSQPETLYLIGQQVSWTNTDVLVDGGAATSGQILQSTATPQVNISAGSSVAANTGAAVGANVILCAVFNGASSALRVNLLTATTGSAGTTAMNGVTIGASGTPGLYSNIRVMGCVVFSAAHSTDTQNQVIQMLASQYGISA